MKMIHLVQAGLADRVKVHQVVVVGHKIVDGSDENSGAESRQPLSGQVQPTGVTQGEGQLATVQRGRHVQRLVDLVPVIAFSAAPPPESEGKNDPKHDASLDHRAVRTAYVRGFRSRTG